MTEDGVHQAGTQGLPPDVDAVAAEAVEAFFAVYALMYAHYGEVCRSFDLTPQMGLILRGLAGPSPMRELARRLGLDASNLTGLADRLETAGLLARRPDPGDRRVRQLVLTREGVELRDALNRRLFAAAPLFAGLDRGQQEELRRLLRVAAGFERHGAGG